MTRQQRTFDAISDGPDSVPIRPATIPRPGQGGRLAMPVDQCSALCLQALEAFDRADLKAAIEPLRTLRLFGVVLKVTLAARPPKEASPHGQR